MFTILIGSVARGEHKINSDIDIVRINHYHEIHKKSTWPQGPINYIDYSFNDFHNLYYKGSLFLYHVLNEGILITGNADIWEDYIREFKFIDTYGIELCNLREILYDVFNTSIYGGTFLSFYANIFTLIKNFSIFFLAHNNVFEFNKEIAFNTVFGGKYFHVLNTAYNVFERDDISSINLFDFKSEILAKDIINHFNKKLGELL